MTSHGIQDGTDDAWRVAVFGSSEPLEGQPDYERARLVGRALAQSSFTVVTGGYGGVMEAACRGAHDAGGRTIGVVSEIFSHRDPNPWIDETVQTACLFDRTRELFRHAEAFMVLPGSAGTLSELTFIWALDRARQLRERPFVLLGDFWEPLIDTCRQRGHLDAGTLERTWIVDDVDAAVDRLRAARHGSRG